MVIYGNLFPAKLLRSFMMSQKSLEKNLNILKSNIKQSGIRVVDY